MPQTDRNGATTTPPSPPPQLQEVLDAALAAQAAAEAAAELAAITPVAGPTNAANAKTTPVDADVIPLIDSAAGFVLKKLSWANLKSALFPFSDAVTLIKNSVDATKLLRFDLSSFTSGATRVASLPNKNGTIAFLEDFNSVNGYFNGGTLSTVGSSATMSISAWVGTDSTNAAYFTLAAIAKTTSAWAVGTAQGGLDTGTIANTRWYHFYAIRRPDTGVVDVVFSTNATSPTLPASYTQFRYLGSALTNASAQWTKFVQNGDTVLWDAPVIDADIVNPGTASVSRTLTVPSGIVVNALLTVGGYNGTNNFAFAITPLSVADTSAQNPLTALLTGTPTDTGGNPGVSSWNFRYSACITDTSRQVRSKLSVSGAADRLGIITRGWQYIR